MSEIKKTLTGRNRFLVSGANGFVGRSLCRELIAQQFPVVACARNAANLDPEIEHCLISSLNAETYWGDKLEHVGVVIHLAARVHVMRELSEDPLAAFQEVNLHGTVNLARQAAHAGVKRFVYVSSVKVNGESTVSRPFHETDAADPQDPYARSKWQAEQALQQIARDTGMEIVIIRPPLVYGPGVKANFLNLLKLVNKAWPLPLASVDNRRSMIYVRNLASALVACATHPGAAGNTYLVSDGKDISTSDLIVMMADSMGKPSRLWPCPEALLRLGARIIGKSAESDRVLGSLAIDSSKIRRELQWQPPFTLQQGIDDTVSYFLKFRQEGH